MPTLFPKTLKVVSAPLVEAVPRAPQRWRCPTLPSNLHAATVVPSCCVGRKEKSIPPWSFATPAARTIRRTSDFIQPVLRRSWIGGGLGVPSALRPNAFAFRGALAGCSFWPRFNASAFATQLRHIAMLGIFRLRRSAKAFFRLYFVDIG